MQTPQEYEQVGRSVPKKHVTFATTLITPTEALEGEQLQNAFLHQYGAEAYVGLDRLETEYLQELDDALENIGTAPPLLILKKRFRDRKLAFFRSLANKYSV